MFIALLCLSINKIKGETSEKERRLRSVTLWLDDCFPSRCHKNQTWWLTEGGGVQIRRKYKNLVIHSRVLFERQGLKDKYHHFYLRKGCIQPLKLLWNNFFCVVPTWPKCLLLLLKLQWRNADAKLKVLVNLQITGQKRRNWRKRQF